MKKIIIIAQYTSMPKEAADGRFLYLANLLSNEKFNVEVISTDFYHVNKKHRVLDTKILEEVPYKFTMLKEPGYKKNVSLKRLHSHYILSKNLKKYLKNLEEKPDVIYCAVPSLSVAKVAAKYAKKNNIRFIIDVQDIWPEAFQMVFNIPVISNIIFFPMKKMADYIYKSADEIVAVSDTYANRAAIVNNKYKNKLTVFLGTRLEYFDKSHKENKVEYNDNKIRLVYIGTLGHSYDLRCTIEALEILKKQGINNIKFMVMGNGPLKESFEEYAKEKDIDCEFTGRLDYEKMVGILCACDIAVNPITKGAAQSVINKVGDYAAAGLPVINTQECEEYRNLVEKYNIGFNCENNNAEDLAKKIEILYNDEELRKKLGNNNRMLAEEKFDREATYQKIIDLVEKND